MKLKSKVKGEDKKLFVEVYPPDDNDDPLDNLRNGESSNRIS